MIATYEQDIQPRAAEHHGPALRDLELRLERGLELIEERKRAGQPVERLEDHWIDLLHAYQLAYDRAH